MSTVISVLSKIPNIGKEINKIAPNLIIKNIETKSDKQDLANSEIILADFDLLTTHINSLNNVKWIQGTWAGVENVLPLLKKKELESVVVTRFSGIHFGRLMSEYVIANIVNYERNLFDVYENKKRKVWSQIGKIHQYRSMQDLTIGILGIGNIGGYIAHMLFSLGAKIWGFGRRETLTGNEEFKNYEQYCTKVQLPELLSHCDYIVNVLPSTDETRGLLNGGILRNCVHRKAVFINIGRGSIVNEKDLIEALKENWISAAILDVFEEEPLSEDNALWNFDQVFVTPHVAGVSRAKDIAEQFVQNLNLYQNKCILPAQIFANKKY